MSKSQARAEDRLSALPDEVICHILSFLRPTRIAVRTTILSKRWRNKWTLVPNLHFDDEEVHRHIDFTRYVNWLLDFRGPSNIQKVQLECSRDFKFWCSTYKDEVNAEHKRRKYVSLIRRWIRTVIGRNLIELDLSIDLFTGQNDFVLPKNLFLSKTLEYLKIGPNFIIKDLPSSGDIFSSLKFLDVVISWPDSNTLKNLFPHFPVLEVMYLIGFLYQNEHLIINISAPKMKTLKIRLDADEGENQEHQFYIKAPNLEYIVLKQAKTHFTVETTKFLVKAKIYIRARYSADRSECTITLPEGISNVKYLCLRGDCFEGCFLLTFNNLNQLNLRFRAFHYGLLLTDWLKKFPSLEYLDIQYNYLCHEDLHLPELVPSCVLSHLKTVSIRGFSGHHCEMEATKYLLRNSGVLSKMTIDTYHLNHEEDKVLLCKELLMCQRGSVNCQLEFIEEIGLFLGGMF